MLKSSIITLTIIMSLTFMVCGGKQSIAATMKTSDYNVGNEPLTGAQMPNPFEDFSTLKEAEKQAGFELRLPDSMPVGYNATNYRVLMSENKLLEVTYKNNNKEICLRKGTLENISGVYTDFPQVESIKIDNVTVTFKGVGGKIQLAEWKKDSFSFSINATEYNEKDFSIGGGLPKEQITALVKSMLLK